MQDEAEDEAEVCAFCCQNCSTITQVTMCTGLTLGGDHTGGGGMLFTASDKPQALCEGEVQS